MNNIIIIFFNVDGATNDDGEEYIKSMQLSLDLKRKHKKMRNLGKQTTTKIEKSILTTAFKVCNEKILRYRQWTWV